jgi:hypothetical protein
MIPMNVARAAGLSVVLALSTAATAEEAPDTATARRAPTGLYVQPHAQLITGWTVKLRTESEITTVETDSGAGLGLRLGYDFTPYVGLFASTELDVESEGPYFGYGGGVSLHTPLFGPARANARLGIRELPIGGDLFYGTAGAGAELFLLRQVSVWLEFDAAFPLWDSTRDAGTGIQVRASAQSGPLRGVFGLSWYIFG